MPRSCDFIYPRHLLTLESVVKFELLENLFLPRALCFLNNLILNEYIFRLPSWSLCIRRVNSLVCAMMKIIAKLTLSNVLFPTNGVRKVTRLLNVFFQSFTSLRVPMVILLDGKLRRCCARTTDFLVQKSKICCCCWSNQMP